MNKKTKKPNENKKNKKNPKMSQREMFSRLANLLTPEEKIVFGNFMDEQEARKAAFYG